MKKLPLFFVLLLSVLTVHAKETPALPGYYYFFPLEESIALNYHETGNLPEDFWHTHRASDSIKLGTNPSVYLQHTRQSGYFLVVSYAYTGPSYQFLNIPFAEIRIQRFDDEWRIYAYDSTGFPENTRFETEKHQYPYDKDCGCIRIGKKKFPEGTNTLRSGNRFQLLGEQDFYQASGNGRVRQRLFGWIGKLFRFNWHRNRTQFEPGFIVLNQSEYRHLDSFHAKAFLIDKKGKAYEGPVKVSIRNTQQNGKYFYYEADAIRYGDGAYGFNWRIPDSLQLDRQYSIRFSAVKRQGVYKDQSFKVTHYTFQDVQVSIRAHSNYLLPEDSNWIVASALDRNGIPLYGARIRLRYSLRNFGTAYIPMVSFPDSFQRLMKDTSLYLLPEKENWIRMDTSMLPLLDQTLMVYAEITTEDGQTFGQNLSFQRTRSLEEYSYRYEGKSMVLEYLFNKRSTKSDTVTLTLKDHFYNEIQERQVCLPFRLEDVQRYSYIEAKKRDGNRVISVYQQYSHPRVGGTKTLDSLYLQLHDHESLNLHWEVYYDKKFILSGELDSLAIPLKGDEPVIIVYRYNQGRNLYLKQQLILPRTSELTILHNLPDLAYPGKKVAVEVEVRDFHRKRVQGANLTGVSINTQMPVITPPYVPYYGPITSELFPQHEKAISWKTYYPRNQLAKDTAVYRNMELERILHYRLYQNPNAIHSESIPSQTGATELQVVMYEADQPCAPKELWIDGELRLQAFSNVLQRNVFLVKGGYHAIKLKGQSYYVELDSFLVEENKKNLLGINTYALPNAKGVRWDRIEPAYEEQEVQAMEEHFLFLSHNTSQASYIVHEGVALEVPVAGQVSNNMARYSAVGPLKEGLVEWLRKDTVIRFYYNPELVYQWTHNKLYTYKKEFFSASVPQIDTRHFQDLPALTKSIILEQWRIEDSIAALNKPVIPYNHNRYRSGQNFDNYYPGYRGNATLFIQQAPEFPINYNFIWLENLETPYLSHYLNTTNKVVSGLNQGWYRLVTGTYQQQMLFVDSIYIDTNTLNFLRIDLTGNTPPPEVWSTMQYHYFKTIQRYGTGRLQLYDAYGARRELKGESKAGEVSGWVSINLQTVSNASIVWINLNGKDRYICRSNSQGYFNHYDMEPGRYLAQVIGPSRNIFFASEIELKPGTMHEVMLNCITDTSLRHRAMTQSNLRRFSTKPGAYTDSEGNFANLQGEIKDREQNKPLPGVRILVSKNGVIVGGDVTDHNGQYHICCLKPGTYDVSFNLIGFQSERYTGVELKEGKTLQLDQHLKVNDRRYEDIEVTEEVALGSIRSDAISPSQTYNTTENIQVLGAKAERLVYKMNAMQIQVNGKADKNTNKEVAGIEEGIDEKKRLDEIRMDEEANDVREDFRTNAFWVPNLVTNKEGKTAFTYTLPGDQTQWVNYLVAIDKNRNTGLNTSYTRSYKPVSASLAVPEFLRTEDSIHIRGKVRNLTGDTLPVALQMDFRNTNTWDGSLLNYNSEVSIPMFYRENWPIRVQQYGSGDSLDMKYALDYQGYRDGERRKVPIKNNLVFRRKVKSRILAKGERVQFPSSSAMKRTIRINSGLQDLILEEINALKSYGYGCTEQTASRLVALLREKQLKAAIKTPFDGEKDILSSIKRLEDFQNRDGSWGWWKGSSADFNLTRYVAEALMLADEEGFRVKSHKRGVGYLINHYQMLDYSQKLQTLILADELGMKLDYDAEIRHYDSLNLNLEAYMSLCQLKLKRGMPADLNRVKGVLKRDAQGYLYVDAPSTWGFNSRILKLTLQAYELFRSADLFAEERVLMKKGIFSKLGYISRNTFERAAILNTLSKEVIETNGGLVNVSMNGQEYHSPVEINPENGVINITNTGEEVSVILIEEYEDPAQLPQYSGISLHSSVLGSSGEISEVEYGKTCRLQVKVSNSEYRHYLVMEVPVPSGFQILNKIERSGYEVAREYYPDRIVLYFERLPKGNYVYTFDLLPQFNGKFQLMPAFMEDMYMPEYFGMERKQWIRVVPE